MDTLPRLSEVTSKLLTIERKNKGPNSHSYLNHKSWLNALVEFTNDPIIDEVEPKMIREYLFGSDIRPIPNLADNRFIAPDNYHEIYKINYILRFWKKVTEKYLINSPMVLPTEDEKKEAVHTLSDKEIDKLLEGCKVNKLGKENPDCLRDQALIMFSLDSGIFMMSEALKGDINIQRGMINIQWGIWGQCYQVYLSERTIEQIVLYMAQMNLEFRTTPYNYLFYNKSSGNALSGTEVQGIWKRIGELSGVEINLLRLLKTYCCRYLMQNNNYDGLYYFLEGEFYSTERMINFFNLSNSEFDQLITIQRDRIYGNSSSKL